MLQLEFNELEGPWLLVLLDSEQVLLVTMNKDNIDTLAAEELCEVDFDGLAVIIHSALLHDFVHCFKHKVFDDDFILEPLSKGNH